MISPALQIILIASCVAVACALLGVFLILRKVSLMSDAISHSILLGIILAFFIVKDLQSPFLILGAALVGVATVLLTELIIKTKKLKEDASIGLVFPFLFSIAVILISHYAGDVHIDSDAVLLGELAFAPFHRFILFGTDLGPHALWVSGSILLLNLLFILLFYKELKIAIFDSDLAFALGFSPAILYYTLMTLVSITAVGSFDAVGSVLVVALMIAPPAAAYLITNRLRTMITLSAGIGILSAITGYFLARAFDANIAGSMAMMTGFFFALALLFSPQRGLLAKLLVYRKQKVLFAAHLLLVHLLDHEGTKQEAYENTVTNATTHMCWKKQFAEKIVTFAIHENLIHRTKDQLKLTSLGRETAREVMMRT